MFSLTSPVKSPYHNVPPGPKFFLLMIASITLFLIGNIYLQAAALAFVLGLYLLPSGTFFKEGLRMLWPLWPFVGIVFLRGQLTTTRAPRSSCGASSQTDGIPVLSCSF